MDSNVALDAVYGVWIQAKVEKNLDEQDCSYPTSVQCRHTSWTNRVCSYPTSVQCRHTSWTNKGLQLSRICTMQTHILDKQDCSYPTSVQCRHTSWTNRVCSYSVAVQSRHTSWTNMVATALELSYSFTKQRNPDCNSPVAVYFFSATHTACRIVRRR